MTVKFRSIEIDFDVHKLIEAERKDFDDTPNSALRRLLGLGDSPVSAPPSREGRSWSSDGVTLPHGTELKMEYNGRTHAGVISDGEWVVENGRYNSPSAAAGGVAVTKRGERTKLDGWIYWRVKRPDDREWRAISKLRAAAAL